MFGNSKHKLPRDVGIIGAIFLFSMMVFYVFHCCWVSAEMYSAPSIVLQSRSPQGGMHVFDDFREAYGWLRHNTHEEAKVRQNVYTVVTLHMHASDITAAAHKGSCMALMISEKPMAG